MVCLCLIDVFFTTSNVFCIETRLYRKKRHTLHSVEFHHRSFDVSVTVYPVYGFVEYNVPLLRCRTPGEPYEPKVPFPSVVVYTRVFLANPFSPLVVVDRILRGVGWYQYLVLVQLVLVRCLGSPHFNTNVGIK